MLLAMFGIVVRLVILFLPIVLLIISFFRKKKPVLILIAVLLGVNSMFMVFSNMRQNDVFNADELNIKTVESFFSNIEYGKEKEIDDQSYVYDKDDEFYQIAQIENVIYKKYKISESGQSIPSEIVKDSSLLNSKSQFTMSKSGVRYYVSDFKKQLDDSCLLYNSSHYCGCLVIKNADEFYYAEYTIVLNSIHSNAAGILEQIFYQQKFNTHIDIMELFYDNN